MPAVSKQLDQLVKAAEAVHAYFDPVVDEPHFDIQEREMFQALEAALAPYLRRRTKSKAKPSN